LADSKRPKNSGSKLVKKKLAYPRATPKANDITEALKDEDEGVKDSPTQEICAVDSLAVIDSNPSLKSADGIFNKLLMLRIGRTTRVTHPKVLGLHIQPRPRRKPPQTPDAPWPKATPAPSTPDEILERRVRSLLNKICPDSLQVISEQLAAMEVKNAEQLGTIIKLIFGIALSYPHYCETYADLVFALRIRYPEFPAEREGEKAVTFVRVLLNTCQQEFEDLENLQIWSTTVEPTDLERSSMEPADLAREVQMRKKERLANVKFIGQLFLRQLLAVKVIGQVVHDLIGIRDKMPEEHMIECTCELLYDIGKFLDLTVNGKALMSQFLSRLIDLKRLKTSGGTAFVFSSVGFQIQNLIDLRGNGWQRKSFRQTVMTKEEGAGTGVMFTTQVVGQRPAYTSSTS